MFHDPSHRESYHRSKNEPLFLPGTNIQLPNLGRKRMINQVKFQSSSR